MFVPTKHQNVTHSHQTSYNLGSRTMRILGLYGRVSAFLLGVVGRMSCVNPTRFGWIHATGLVTKRVFTQVGVCGELRETVVGGNNFQKILIINRLQSKNAWLAPVDFIF